NYAFSLCHNSWTRRTRDIAKFLLYCYSKVCLVPLSNLHSRLISTFYYLFSLQGFSFPMFEIQSFVCSQFSGCSSGGRLAFGHIFPLFSSHPFRTSTLVVNSWLFTDWAVDQHHPK